MIERETEHTTFLQFDHLSRIPGLRHAVFTRLKGFSTGRFAGLNASFTTGDDPAVVAQNRAAIIDAVGLPLLGAHPVHGTAVEILEASEIATARQPAAPWTAIQQRLRQTDADAMLTDAHGFAFCWAFGDCAPILLFDPVHHALGMVHAGWHGTAGGIALHAVAAMRDRYGTDAGTLFAGIGPTIQACCYEVDGHVEEAFDRNGTTSALAVFEKRAPDTGAHGTGLYLDLARSNFRQLVAAGVRESRIEVAPFCTGCRTDVFYSHRKEPRPSGRFAVAIGLADPALIVPPSQDVSRAWNSAE